MGNNWISENTRIKIYKLFVTNNSQLVSFENVQGINCSFDINFQEDLKAKFTIRLQHLSISDFSANHKLTQTFCNNYYQLYTFQGELRVKFTNCLQLLIFRSLKWIDCHLLKSARDKLFIWFQPFGGNSEWIFPKHFLHPLKFHTSE